MIQSSRRVRIAAFGFFDETGFGGSASHGRRPPVPLADLTWSLVSPEPFKRFGQLDAVAKTTLTAIEMAGLRELAPQDTAIYAATSEGCLGADIEFAQSMAGDTGPSPRLFAYTLPSTVLGEIAIRYCWTGSNLCLVTDDSLAALIEGYFAVATGDSPACLSVGYDALFAPSAAKAKERGMLQGDGCPRAHAFLLLAEDLSSNVSGWYLSLGRADTSAPLPALSSLREVKDFMTRSGQTADAGAILGGESGQPILLRREASSG